MKIGITMMISIKFVVLQNMNQCVWFCMTKTNFE